MICYKDEVLSVEQTHTKEELDQIIKELEAEYIAGLDQTKLLVNTDEHLIYDTKAHKDIPLSEYLKRQNTENKQ